jgi:hypothetical protein
LIEKVLQKYIFFFKYYINFSHWALYPWWMKNV